MWAVLRYRTRASEALPFIIRGLHYQPTSEVRSNAVRVLEQLGSQAQPAAEDLIIVLQNDAVMTVRADAACALGAIGEKQAVPALAKAIYGDDEDLAVCAARSISLISGESFPDANPQGGYRIVDGIPLVVSTAREWWEREGRIQDWGQ